MTRPREQIQRCVCVKISGTDPKQVKALYSVNSTSADGITTVTTSATTKPSTSHPLLSTANAQASFVHLPPACISTNSSPGNLQNSTHTPTCRIECIATPEQQHHSPQPNHQPHSKVIKANLISILFDNVLADALQTLISSPSLASGSWQIAWSEKQLPIKTIAHILILQLDTAVDTSDDIGSTSATKGDSSFAAMYLGMNVSAIGCPFAALSQRFTNYTCQGIIASIIQPKIRNTTRYDNMAKRSNFETSNFHKATPPPLHVALLLADLKTLPGMEGCPVVTTSNCNKQQSAQPALHDGNSSALLVGMLLPPLQAKHVEAEFQPVVPASHFLSLVGRQFANNTLGSAGGFVVQRALSSSSIGDTGNTKAIPEYVVPVMCGASWATGIVVDIPGSNDNDNVIILTCAHAVKSSNAGDITSTTPMKNSPSLPPPPYVLLETNHNNNSGTNTWQEAQVYLCDEPLDLVILKVPIARRNRGVRGISLAPTNALLSCQQPSCTAQSQQLVKSTQCVVVGYPIWHPRSRLGPIAHSGNIAKVFWTVNDDPKATPSAIITNFHNNNNSQPAMLLTTASVISGASGGAVIDIETGQLLGMVTSNAKIYTKQKNTNNSSSGGEGKHQKQTIYPRLNFCIPTNLLNLAVQSVVNRDTAAQQQIDALKDQLAAIWCIDSNSIQLEKGDDEGATEEDARGGGGKKQQQRKTAEFLARLKEMSKL